MQFICSVANLINGLQIVTKALPNRTTNEILECVRIETDENAIIMTCTDERITIMTRVSAEIKQHGRGLVTGKLFNEVIRRLPEGDVSITMNERFIFNIRSSTTRMNIPGQDADLFPMLPQVDREHEIALPQDMLRDMIQKTEFAISSENVREVLTGCYLEIGSGDVNMVALDGYRMALCRKKISDAVESFSAIIPGRAIGDIGKLLSEEEDAFASLSMGGNKLHIKLENTEIFVILVEGEYIRYRAILPTDFNTRITLDLESFRRCVDRASLFAREGGNNLLLLKIEDSVLVIEAHSQVGDFHEEIDVSQEGENLNIAFNVKYLNDVVRYIDAPQIEMRMRNAISPCIITPVEDESYMHMVMPVRTTATER